VTVMIARLRKLHTKGKPGTASFMQTVHLLHTHTEGSVNSSTDWFRKVLDWHKARVEPSSAATAAAGGRSFSVGDRPTDRATG
jgi:hypothetical protein